MKGLPLIVLLHFHAALLGLKHCIWQERFDFITARQIQSVHSSAAQCGPFLRHCHRSTSNRLFVVTYLLQIEWETTRQITSTIHVHTIDILASLGQLEKE